MNQSNINFRHYAYKLQSFLCWFADAPTRGRELKWRRRDRHADAEQDAPYAGARIEITGSAAMRARRSDAPYAGARIEIF